MPKNVKKLLFWIIITLFLFGFFRWLFNIIVPDAALAFSVGLTVILVGGLLSGRYMAKAWLIKNTTEFTWTVAALIVSALSCLVLIGLFITRMLKHTEFNFFLFTVICIFLLSAIVAAIITLLRARVKENIRQTETALSQSKTELQLLQSQLSPHFLFNTLNNLYGLSISDHSRIPVLLLKLSELLRYSVYDAKEIFVPLQDEIQYLENYIEFEKIRLGERLSLSCFFGQVSDPSIVIAPMLLVVFVENAFKHSKNNYSQNIYIEMNFEITAGKIIFFIKNSFKPGLTVISINKKHSGFGLESVRKRLELLYKQKHTLEIITSDHYFTVKLTLDIDDN
ncbi:MAG: sensor histidine kinase [Sediminibacterium sp.]